MTLLRIGRASAAIFPVVEEIDHVFLIDAAIIVEVSSDLACFPSEVEVPDIASINSAVEVEVSWARIHLTLIGTHVNDRGIARAAGNTQVGRRGVIDESCEPIKVNGCVWGQ